MKKTTNSTSANYLKNILVVDSKHRPQQTLQGGKGYLIVKTQIGAEEPYSSKWQDLVEDLEQYPQLM